PDLQPQAAQQTGLAPDASVPIAGARPTTPEEGWTYLIDVRDQKTFSPNPPLIMREQNTVPKDVVDYMLARQQQLATLQHMHRPMTASGHAIGGPGVRNPQPRMSESGLETGTGMAAEMYVEGAREGGLDPTAASLQQTLKTAREQSGAKPGGSGDVAQQVIDAFQTEVTRYLNEYFEKNQTVALRVGAILAIAEAEHNIHLAFDVFTNADKFRDMIEKTVEISAGLAVLSSFGVWGELASAAIGAYLRSKGVANVTAVISIGAFLKQAADADSFGAARGWGLVAGQVAIDLSSVMQNIVNDPIAKAVHGAVKKGLSTPGDVADTIRPTMKDPAAREAVLGAIDQRLTELASKQGDPAAESEAHQLRSFRDSLLGQSKMIDAGDLHTPLKEPSAQERAASIFEKPHQRSARDVAAMHAALGDLAAKVPLIENPTLPGSTVQVRYGDGGGVRIEYGPEAEPRHIEYHRETARELMGYEGVLGHIRRVADKVLTALRLTPGYGTKGFEASHEVKKLRAIERDLQAREQAIGKSLETISEHPETAQRELAKIRRELEAVQKPLDEGEKAVDDYSQGRGIVAAVAPESAAPVGWPVDPVNPRKNSRGQWIGMPDTVPDRRVLEFPGGERIWRNPATREIVIESTLGPAPGRQRHARQFPARGEYAQDYQSAMYELAHAQGQGTGFESPYALLLAPSEVNQRLQRWGIEEYLYRLRDATPQGTDFHLVTSSSARPRSRELASIEYRIDVSNAQGQRKPLFAFTISVEGDRSNPHVFIDPESVWMSSDRDLETLRDMVDMSDIHERFEQADLAARLRGRP
ncbi:MAG: polymorphic toxin type 4 domain-containing protein, partial [Gaiellales bacterium]